MRRQILRGGSFLAVRQAVGMGIGIVGVISLTRMIGPEHYGRYAAALGLLAYIQSLFTWGINVYLIRLASEHEAAVYDQGFTLLLLSGLTAAGLGFLLAGSIESWTKIPGLRLALGSMLVVLPLVLTSSVPLAQLERALKYREVAAIELTGQITYYAVAIPMAYGGRLASAPFAGWISQQVLMGLLYFGVSKYGPRLRWNRRAIRSILGYGLAFSATMWIWQLRLLVSPIIVGRFLGLDAVAVVALTVRLVEYLTFVKAAAWRLSMAALARLQSDMARMSDAISAGMMLQVLAVGPILIAFSVVSPWVVPRLFGTEWMPTIALFPFVALSYLVNSLFNMHCSALYTLRLNWAVAKFHILHVLLFAGAALFLVPRLGLIGYGLAELLAIASYILVFVQVRETVGRVDSGTALAWATALCLALFHREIGVLSLFGLVAVGIVRSTRQGMASVVLQLVSAVRGSDR